MKKEEYQVGFTYTFEHIGKDGNVISTETVHNIIPTAGINYLLNAGFKGGSQFSTWYLSLWTANVTPVAGDTMVSFMATCVEDTVYTVVGGARQTITFGSVASGELLVPSANVFEFASGSTIRGAFVTSNPTRGNNSGLLISAVSANTAKVLAAGESLRVPVGFSITSV